MKVAIYSRKSKTSDKGESIDNQIHMCKEYALAHFNNPEFFIFEDEGFSGGDTNRPQFKIMINELNKGLYDVLMCYRLDRISRNVSDFSSTLDMLTKNNIGFVSIKENFDTTTPIGRAMIHISSVFAQLERETIAERVTDNLLELAKLGRWLGGTTPVGYKSKKVSYSVASKTKYYSMLEQDFNTVPIVQLIYNKYLELGSISQVETYLLQEGIKTPNNANYHSNVIRGILINPVYTEANMSIYKYFTKLNCIIPCPQENFTSQYGIMPYNRYRKGKNNRMNDTNKWIIAVGEHIPIIESEIWLKVQKQLQLNHKMSFSNTGTSLALLSGLIYCKNCGSVMQVAGQNILADGTIAYNYRCTTKVKSRGKVCSIENISKGYILDRLVIQCIKEMLYNQSDIVYELNKAKAHIMYQSNPVNDECLFLHQELVNNKIIISNLIKKLATFNDKTMEKYIMEEVTSVHKRNTAIQEQLHTLKMASVSNDYSITNIECIISSIMNFDKQIEFSSLNEKKALIRSLIKRIEWDGKNIDIYFYLNEGT